MTAVAGRKQARERKLLATILIHFLRNGGDAAECWLLPACTTSILQIRFYESLDLVLRRMDPTSVSTNKTLEILRRAEIDCYGVLAQICYDAQSVVALVRSAERNRSPAIIQMFPITLAYGKGPFLRFCLDLAAQASVPIAVHLDHATDPEHLELALNLAENGVAFDSIMVDASHADSDEENMEITRPYVERASKLGIAVEVELGRLEGGEAGLRAIADAKLTDPKNAQVFINHTKASILAPSIGNLHGSYINPPKFKLDIVRELRRTFDGNVPICLHGTDELPDELFKDCIKSGVSKINVNSWARDPYVKSFANGLQSKTLPEAIEDATEVFAQICDRFFVLFGSIGKA